MANKKLTQLTEVTTLADTDLVYVVTDAATSPASKGIAVSNLKTSVVPTLQEVLTEGNAITESIIFNGNSLPTTIRKTTAGLEINGDKGVFVRNASLANDIKLLPETEGVSAVLDYSSYTTGTPANDEKIYAQRSYVDDSISAITTFPLGFAFGDEKSDIEVGTDKLTFQMPNFATTLTGVSVNLKTAPTGSVATFDLNEAGVSLLSTKITIDAGEKTSVTAAIPPVISDSAIAANAIITVDIDGVGSTIAGVAPKLWIYYTRA